MIALWLLACAGAPDSASDLDSAPPVDETPRGAVSFGFPLPEVARISMRIGVDHDPVEQADSALGRAICTDYVGRAFPHCYDGHDGSDFVLDGGFDAMDAGSTPVVAAAAGTVISTADGNYDRCHADLGAGDVSCDGHPVVANHVILDHGGGITSLYWHLKSGSVAVAVGDVLPCGAHLGLVGSSGYSSVPHLHFEVQVDGVGVDPYAGPSSQIETWWAEQGEIDGMPGPGCAAP